MHSIEPFFNWRDYYTSEEDEYSPFYQKEHDEFHFTNSIYNHAIHPQWDEMGSPTLYLKVLYADYEDKYVIIELLGEWNDCISNDIMYLKREIIDVFLSYGIYKFILIGENVLNFHYEGEDYYEEWFQDVEDGWIAAVNFQPHVLQEFRDHNIDYFLNFGGDLDELSWRTFEPEDLYKRVNAILGRRLSIGT